MSGHNKWAQIKRQKGKTDAQKSKAFSKFSRLITAEAKKSGGGKAGADRNSPALKAIIERARAINMPNDSIERAIKKSTEQAATMESAIYEAYGPGGCALIIDTLTDNKNKVSQEIKHILSKNSFALAGMGAASWAFEKTADGWIPKTTIILGGEDIQKLDVLITELEEDDDVQAVYTNAE